MPKVSPIPMEGTNGMSRNLKIIGAVIKLYDLLTGQEIDEFFGDQRLGLLIISEFRGQRVEGSRRAHSDARHPPGSIHPRR